MSLPPSVNDITERRAGLARNLTRGVPALTRKGGSGVAGIIHPEPIGYAHFATRPANDDRAKKVGVPAFRKR
jgi:hypothetical protein